MGAPVAPALLYTPVSVLYSPIPVRGRVEVVLTISLLSLVPLSIRIPTGRISILLAAATAALWQTISNMPPLMFQLVLWALGPWLITPAIAIMQTEGTEEWVTTSMPSGAIHPQSLQLKRPSIILLSIA